jgi:hypothetical protein
VRAIAEAPPPEPTPTPAPTSVLDLDLDDHPRFELCSRGCDGERVCVGCIGTPEDPEPGWSEFDYFCLIDEFDLIPYGEGPITKLRDGDPVLVMSLFEKEERLYGAFRKDRVVRWLAGEPVECKTKRRGLEPEDHLGEKDGVKVTPPPPRIALPARSHADAARRPGTLRASGSGR